jgi:hypothetical protein
VMCTACTAVFEAPADASAAPAPPQPPPPSMATPQPQQWGPPPPANPYQAPAPYNMGAPAPFQGGGVQTMNTLAIVSLVLGILCCMPFSIGAIITGAIAIKQIDNNPMEKGKGLAVAGIVLGSLAIVVNLLWAIGAAAS